MNWPSGDEGDVAAVELAREHESAGLPRRLPATVLSELYVVVGAGVLQGQHLVSDTKPNPGIADATIAATALVYNEALVTDDSGDFGSVDGLHVLDWS